MSILKRNRRIGRPTLPTIVAAAGVIIAIAIAAVALTSNRPDRTQPITTTHTTQSPYLPAIQTPGTGQAHIVLDPRTGQAHGTVTPPTNPTTATPNNPDTSDVGHRADA